jgi:hypothetical protein
MSEKLSYIRKEINTGDYSLLQNLLGELLTDIPFDRVLKIILQQIQDFIPEFEIYHPEIVLPKELFNALLYLDSSSVSDLYEFIEDKLNGKSSVFFAQSLFYLNYSITSYKENNLISGISFAESAISSLVAAKFYIRWCKSRPEDCAKLEEMEAEERTEISQAKVSSVSDYLNLDERNSFIKKAWLELVDNIEKETTSG